MELIGREGGVVAQWLEGVTPDQEVVGSILPGFFFFFGGGGGVSIM